VRGERGQCGRTAARWEWRAATRTAGREWAGGGRAADSGGPAAKAASCNRVLGEHPELLAAADASNPMGRIGDPDLDIAPVAVFLASDASRYVTGNTLFVDGGGHINGAAWKPDLGD